MMACVGDKEAHNKGGEDLPEQGVVPETGLSALFVEQSEKWMTGRRYLDMQDLREYRREEREVEEVVLMKR